MNCSDPDCSCAEVACNEACLCDESCCEESNQTSYMTFSTTNDLVGSAPRQQNVYSMITESIGIQQERNCFEEALYYCETEVCFVCPSLSWKQRLYGCIACMLLGFFVSIGSFSRFSELVGGDPRPFVAQYILGNILALCSTCLLHGPLSQSQIMLANTRIATTGIYLALTVAIIVAAYWSNPDVLLVLLFVLAQYLTLAWYTLSMLSWGQQLFTNCIFPVFIKCCCPNGDNEENCCNL